MVVVKNCGDVRVCEESPAAGVEYVEVGSVGIPDLRIITMRADMG